MIKSFLTLLMYILMYVILCIVIYIVPGVICGLIARDINTYYSLIGDLTYAICFGPIAGGVATYLLEKIHNKSTV